MRAAYAYNSVRAGLWRISSRADDGTETPPDGWDGSYERGVCVPDPCQAGPFCTRALQ